MRSRLLDGERVARIAAMMVVLGGVTAEQVRAEDVAPAAESAPAAMRATVDPQTGALVPGPAPGTLLVPQGALSRSAAGLLEEPAPGGGVMVDLQGRFRNTMASTVGVSGETHTECRSGSSGTAHPR